MRSRNEDYEVIGRWAVPILAWAPCFGWNKNKMFEEFGFCSKGDMLILDGYWLSHKSCRETIKKSLEKSLEQNDFEIINMCLKKTMDYFDEFLNFKKELDNYKKKTLIDITEDFFKRYAKLEVPWITCFNVAGALEKRLMRLAKEKGYNENEIIAYLHPKRLTFSKEQKNEMQEIRKEIVEKGIIKEIKSMDSFGSKYPEIFEKMQAHVKKYEWLGTLHFWGDDFNMLDLINKLQEDEKTFEHKEYNLPEDLRMLIEVGSDLVWVRQQAPDISTIMCYAARPLLKEIASEFKITYDDLIWMTPDEIISHLKEKTSPGKEELHERKNASGMYIDDGKLKVIIGKELENEIDKWLNSEIIDKDIIEGVVANKGKAVGKVNVMKNPFSQEFNEGEILVTSETTPDFLPVMTKAAAFVTDIGGITSHAAVIAREMDKPCIINTINATMILRTGDLVEVDADSGEVRVLERAS